MPSVFKRFSTIIRRDNADKKDKRKSLAIFPKSKDTPKKEEELRSKGKKIVVVSGASVGLGAELVQRFAKEHGTFVIALDTGIAPSAELKKHLSDDVVAVRLELKDISKAVTEIEKLTGGRIDILVNSAVPAKHSAKNVSEILHGDINSELSAMVTTPIAVTNALLPLLKKYTPPPPPPMETAAPAASEEKKDAAPAAMEEKKDAAAAAAPTTEVNGVAPPAAPVPASATETQAASPPPAAATETALPAPTPSEAPTTTPAPSAAPETSAPAPSSEPAPTSTLPADAITDSSGNPVSKNDLLAQKFLKDEVQDPKLLPHVEGKTYGSEAAQGKIVEREPVLVKNADIPVGLGDVAPAPKVEGEGEKKEDEGMVKKEGDGMVANGSTTANGTTEVANGTATTTEAPKTEPATTMEPTPPPAPTFPENPIVAFLTLSRPAHASFPPVPYATQSMAHAALHVALTKYSHDLAAKGVVVVGLEVGGWDDADAMLTSTQTTESIITDLGKVRVKDNGKILHHHSMTAPLLNWSSFKSNALL